MADKIKIQVNQMGKQREEVTLEKGQTINDLKNLLGLSNLELNVVDPDGNKLEDTHVVKTNVTVIPRIQGGSFNSIGSMSSETDILPDVINSYTPRNRIGNNNIKKDLVCSEDLRFVSLVDNGGLFKVNIPLNSLNDQKHLIASLSIVKQIIDFEKREFKVNLGDKGKYYIRLDKNPIARRINILKDEWDNPFIAFKSPHYLCMGANLEGYNAFFLSKNFLGCLELVCAVLQSKDDSNGYRKWKDC
ncbi:MAG: hypothetical protein A2Z57_07090 [Planctomycetes bacterium RIFCSPHIGHO2_12_39_6]|nr:MAG: hypothetical protein A2Z57_07090 [Planctomycetes bacterium RIFCSPHIGHO2_12_39_6]